MALAVGTRVPKQFCPLEIKLGGCGEAAHLAESARCPGRAPSSAEPSSSAPLLSAPLRSSPLSEFQGTSVRCAPTLSAGERQRAVIPPSAGARRHSSPQSTPSPGLGRDAQAAPATSALPSNTRQQLCPSRSSDVKCCFIRTLVCPDLKGQGMIPTPPPPFPVSAGQSEVWCSSAHVNAWVPASQLQSPAPAVRNCVAVGLRGSVLGADSLLLRSLRGRAGS